MKKILSILLLTCVLCLSVFADGETPVGGKNCQPPVQCLTIPDDGDDKTASEDPTDPTETRDALDKIKDWLSQIFG